MKKTPKKLVLDRETLRRLSEGETTLRQVQGALQAAEDQTVSCIYCNTVPNHSC